MSAANLCADFKDRTCPHRMTRQVLWPGPALRLGEAVEITYRSDKWIPDEERRRGRTQDYFHPFEGQVEVIADADSRLAENPGASRRLTPPPPSVAWLAQTLELKVRERPHGPIRVIRFDVRGKKGPALYAFRTGPHKAVLVVACAKNDGGALILRGGKLDVRPEGIVG